MFRCISLQRIRKRSFSVNINESLLHFLHQLHQCAFGLTLHMIEYLLFNNHRLFFAFLKMDGLSKRMVTFSQNVIFGIDMVR